jgi:PEGA domain
VTRHIRFVVLAAFVTAVLLPTGLSAGQRSRSNPRPSGGQGSGAPRPSGSQGPGTAPRPSGATAVPRPPYSYRPYYNTRYYYPRYYPGYYGYRPYYGYYGYPGFYTGFYNPYFWGSYGFGFGVGYGAGYGYPYGYGYGYGQYPYPPYYYGPYYDNSGSARLQVVPRNTQVYVDGYFVGVVDSFDGNLQRLNVEAGEHELQLYLEGYRPFTQKVLFPRSGTLRVTHAMQPLGPGESAGPPPKPDESQRARPYRDPGQAPEGSGSVRPAPMPRGGQPSEFGSLLLRVRPADADILVDGEPWRAPQGEDQFVIELGEGPHRIEVRKDGFQTYATMVRVRRGETIRLNVSLTSGGLNGGF